MGKIMEIVRVSNLDIMNLRDALIAGKLKPKECIDKIAIRLQQTETVIIELVKGCLPDCDNCPFHDVVDCKKCNETLIYIEQNLSNLKGK